MRRWKLDLLSNFHGAAIPTPQSGESLICISSLRSLIIAKATSENSILVITPSSRIADELSDEIRSYLGDVVINFPAWETLPHERLSPKSDTVTARISALHKINSKSKFKVVVTSIRGALQPIVSDILEEELITLSVGQKISMAELTTRLSYFGFVRTDLVEKRGDFAVRGGILDFFAPDREHPIRIDFFGDEIDEMQYFLVADQRTYADVKNQITIYPGRELLISEEVKVKARYLVSEFPQLAEMAGKISEGICVEGMESLAALLKPSFKNLLDFLPKSYQVVAIDQPRLKSRAADLVLTNEEFLEASWSSAAIGGTAPIDLTEIVSNFKSSGYCSFDELKDLAASLDLPFWSIDPYAQSPDELSQANPLSNFEAIPIYEGNIDNAIVDISNWINSDYNLIFSASGAGILERYQVLFRESQITGIKFTTSSIEHGFINHLAKVALITEKDISGARTSSKDQARMPSRRKKAIDPLELKPGDYVVHEQHGVGKYLELVNRTVANISREYLVIEYAASKRGQPADRLFVPTDTLEQITRYVGGEAPSVNRIGGSDWQNTKRRARKAVKQIAAELIQLYAARMSAPGFAFSQDTAWQRELEAAFAYVETTDQLATIEEVKADMEKSHPMDRVVCGDVGYGKTEIAVRAAFKAVQDGKQVAVLVPTTLLVQQHLTTFHNRYTGFPIKVAGLSRFNTPKEGREILEGIKSGAIDVVIGTHRLLSKDVEFRDLGLVIVDEEQRFGVEHKEELKKTRTNVDVLSMSATPIPRTLEMAITGIREMSNITTPPEERHPVLTYVGPYDDKQVTAAIHRELLRDGQIFYIHNRVESIDGVVERLHKLVPEAKIRVAHGQMGERELEDAILGFWQRDFDILVCTTIIESGIDIPNANTLIVDRADTFGLSQLHQLRGRVGRSRERAYAYFLYSADKPLTEVAHDRLTTIATNTDLGSGMQVALKDLEIRGAGNLLGGEQSGHIAEVGFDLYMRMVGEAVEEFKTGFVPQSEDESKFKECKVELPVTAHIPVEYLTSERLRLDIYRRMADAQNSADLDAIKEELIDRFGELPTEAINLMAVANLRTLAKSLGLTEVVLQGKHLRLAPLNLPDSAVMRLNRIYPGSIVKTATSTVLVARASAPNWIAGGEIGDTSVLPWTIEVLTSIVAPVKK
ncbi:MAG: transcription-repair coupling factor [Actinobacteria bacterium]|nr:transcription-repair coupling factor [Actinomycetota bacterium]